MVAEIVSVGKNHVTVKEASGITTVYRGWKIFLDRTDAYDLCDDYADKLYDLLDLVNLKAFSN
jgi:hypothetical protein